VRPRIGRIAFRTVQSRFSPPDFRRTSPSPDTSLSTTSVTMRIAGQGSTLLVVITGSDYNEQSPSDEIQIKYILPAAIR
jgi:hypothetical protein